MTAANDVPGNDPAEIAAWLLDLAREGDAARLLAYVDAGAPVNMRSDKGDSLLMLAAYHEHPELVRGLLERGADHTILNDRGQSVLAGVVFKNNPEIIGILLEAGADPDHGTPSARETAAMFGVELTGN